MTNSYKSLLDVAELNIPLFSKVPIVKYLFDFPEFDNLKLIQETRKPILFIKNGANETKVGPENTDILYQNAKNSIMKEVADAKKDNEY